LVIIVMARLWAVLEAQQQRMWRAQFPIVGVALPCHGFITLFGRSYRRHRQITVAKMPVQTCDGARRRGPFLRSDDRPCRSRAIRTRCRGLQQTATCHRGSIGNGARQESRLTCARWISSCERLPRQKRANMDGTGQPAPFATMFCAPAGNNDIPHTVSFTVRGSSDAVAFTSSETCL